MIWPPSSEDRIERFSQEASEDFYKYFARLAGAGLEPYHSLMFNDTMAQNAKKIPALFPPGSLEGKTAAKKEIWEKWPEFEASAKNFEMEAGKLRDTAKTNNKEATDALVKDFGRKACGTCHTPFRVPPPPAPSKG